MPTFRVLLVSDGIILSRKQGIKKMLRSFIGEERELGAGEFRLGGLEAHHLMAVRRVRKGESVELLNGCGLVASAKFMGSDGKYARLRVLEQHYVAPPPRGVVLLQALTKPKSFDLVVRIATELGVRAILPVQTANSEIRLKDQAQIYKKQSHWLMIMIEACKQSGNPWLPDLRDLCSLRERLRDEDYGKPTQARIVAALDGQRRSLKAVAEAYSEDLEYVVAIGPEGDFNSKELALLDAEGFQRASLGDYVLRAETAALYALSVLRG